MSEETNVTIRLSKAAKEFNVGVSTIREYLAKKGFQVDSSPNAKLTADMYNLLVKEYQGEKEVKLGQTDDAINYISIKNITYMSDGKLYHYNGKDSDKIASKVDHVWFNGIMNGLYLNMW